MVIEDVIALHVVVSVHCMRVAVHDVCVVLPKATVELHVVVVAHFHVYRYVRLS
jgi:hypothetical protein